MNRRLRSSRSTGKICHLARRIAKSDIGRGPFTRISRTLPCLYSIVFSALTVSVLASGRVCAFDQNLIDNELAREGREMIIDKKTTRQYERALFVTLGEVARYVLISNRDDYGDRSAAIDQTPHRKGASPGGYWVTATEADFRLKQDHQKIPVTRRDAPIPESTATLLHALWLTVLERTRIQRGAVPCAPTSVFSATTPRGKRLKAVTIGLRDDSICRSMEEIGLSLVGYPKLPADLREAAALKIERNARGLLIRAGAEKRANEKGS